MRGQSSLTIAVMAVVLVTLTLLSLCGLSRATSTWSGGGWSQVAAYDATPYCLSYNVYTAATAHNVTFVATYYVQPASNLTALIVGYRVLIVSGIVTAIVYQDLLPPTSAVNNVLYSGADNSVGLPVTAALYSNYMRQYLGPGQTLNDSNSQIVPLTAQYLLRSGTCSDFSQSVWFYPQPALQSACMSYTAMSSDSSVVVTFTAAITFDGNRYTSYTNSSGAIQYGYPVVSINGTRVVAVSSQSSSITTAVSLSYSNGASLTPMMLQMQSSPYFYQLSFNAGAFTPPTAYNWTTTSPTFNRIVWLPASNSYVEAGTGYAVSNLRASTAGCAATAPPSPPLPSAGLTATCVSGYWSDMTAVHGMANVVYQLTVLYNASNLLYNPSLAAYYTPIVDIQGTRTVWQSGVNTTQWLTLLPAYTLRNASNYFFPNSSTWLFDTQGVSFTAYPAGATSNLTLSYSTSAGAYVESGFLSGMLAFTPNQTCVTWPADQSSYYGKPQLTTYAFSLTVGNSTNRAVVAGTVTVDVGRLVTSPVNARAMYRVTALIGQWTPYYYAGPGPGWQIVSGRANITLSTSTLNLIYLPSTGFVTLPANTVLLDTNGWTYKTIADTYTVISAGAGNPVGYVLERDVAYRESGWTGQLSVCMAGLSCPVSYPVTLCVQYTAINSQANYLYPLPSSTNVSSSLLATITVNTSGGMTSMRGTRFVQDGTATGFTQYVNLLPAGTICYGGGCTDNSFSLTHLPYFTQFGWAYTTYPDYYTYGQGSVWVSGMDNFNTVAEDPVHAQLGQSSVSGGVCSNYAAVQWYYPTAIPTTATLAYTFTAAAPKSIMVSTSLVLTIDTSRQRIVPYGVLPLPNFRLQLIRFLPSWPLYRVAALCRTLSGNGTGQC